MEHVMTAQPITKANGRVAPTVFESDSNSTDHMLQAALKPVFKPSPASRSEIECALADNAVVMRTNVESIVEILMTKWTITLQLQILTVV